MIDVILREGVPGRVCRTCGDWVPLSKMCAKGRARTCMACKRKKPEQIFSILRSKAQTYRRLTWTLTYEEFLTFWQRPCHYCGVEIKTVGLDRVESSQGYEMDNLVSCCGDCNRGKSDQTQAEFLARCRRVWFGRGVCETQ